MGHNEIEKTLGRIKKFSDDIALWRIENASYRDIGLDTSNLKTLERYVRDLEKTVERQSVFIAALIYPIRTSEGDIYDRPKGKCRAVNQNFRHVKGVFDSPVSAFEALESEGGKK